MGSPFHNSSKKRGRGRLGRSIAVQVSSAAWTPTSLGSTLLRWYNTQYTTGTWVDEKGVSNLTQAAGPTQPTVGSINGHTCPSFARASAQFLFDTTLPPVLQTTTTFWYVMRPVSLPGSMYAFYLGDFFSSGPACTSRIQSTGTDVRTNSGGTASSSNPAISDAGITVNTTYYVVVTWDAAAGGGAGLSQLYVNGVLQADTGNGSTNQSGASAQNMVAGASPSGITLWDGFIGNMGVCDTVLSAGNLALLHTYLSGWSGV